jgi:putative membrane protein
MKKKLRSALFASMSFLLLAGFYPGFSFTSVSSITISTVAYGLLHLFVRPVLKLLSIPFNLITFGMFSLFVNVAILYLLSFFVPSFALTGFSYAGFDIFGTQVHAATLNQFLSAVAASTILSLLDTFFFWLVS